MRSLHELPAFIDVTDEIRLRPLVIADTEELCELVRQNAEHLDTFGASVSSHYIDRKRIAFNLAGCTPDVKRYALTSRDRMIGGIHTFSDVPDSSIEIGYWLDCDHTGRGITTAALGALKNQLIRIHPRLKATVHPDNLASRRVLEKNAFTMSTHEVDDATALYRFNY